MAEKLSVCLHFGYPINRKFNGAVLGKMQVKSFEGGGRCYWSDCQLQSISHVLMQQSWRCAPLSLCYLRISEWLADQSIDSMWLQSLSGYGILEWVANSGWRLTRNIIIPTVPSIMPEKACHLSWTLYRRLTSFYRGAPLKFSRTYVVIHHTKFVCEHQRLPGDELGSVYINIQLLVCAKLNDECTLSGRAVLPLCGQLHNGKSVGIIAWDDTGKWGWRWTWQWWYWWSKRDRPCRDRRLVPTEVE